MNIVVGSGNNRRSFTIGHKATMKREERDKMKEDLKAFILRPASFVGHSATRGAGSRSS